MFHDVSHMIPLNDNISRMQVMMTAPKNSHKPTGFLFCSTTDSDRYPVLRSAVVIG